MTVPLRFASTWQTFNVATDALALAIGLPLAGPVVREVPGLDLLADLPSATTPLPVAGNLTIDGAAVTRGLRQYPEKLTSVPCTADTDCDKNYCVTTSGRCAEEGHWVVFHRDAAIRQYSRFLATAVRDKVPTIVK